MMPFVHEGGRWLHLSRAECEDLDIDLDEGKERDDDAPPCPVCGNLPCACADLDEEEDA